MTKKRDRAFAGFGAILFLVTSSALTIAVIVSLVSQGSSNNSSGNTQKSTKQLNLVGTAMPSFTPTSTPLTQLEVSDTKVGTGAVVKAGDTITADYTGALMSTGKVFDASVDHGGPQTFTLTQGQLIPGWVQGIPGMKVGGTRRLLIPATLGYGAEGSGSTIPPNSDLVFDVTVDKIN